MVKQFQAPKAFDKLLEDDRKGRKNGKGFYLWQRRRRATGSPARRARRRWTRASTTCSASKPQARLAGQEIAERCVLLMLNEAAMALDSGVVASAGTRRHRRHLRYRLPPFLGGPFRYMDSLGIDYLVGRLEHHQKRFGDRFAPRGSRRWRRTQRFYG